MPNNLPSTPSLPPVLPSETPTGNGQDALTGQFEQFLKGSKSLSTSSIKNYVSDIGIFLAWLKLSLQEDNLTPAHITAASVLSYRDYLNNSRQTLSAKNRYLSSLRRFGHFLFTTKLSDTNPASHLVSAQSALSHTSASQILAEFKHDLNKQNLSESTIKNYLSDVKQYFRWVMVSMSNHKITDNIQDSREWMLILIIKLSRMKKNETI